jgi:hypothetical protein
MQYLTANQPSHPTRRHPQIKITYLFPKTWPAQELDLTSKTKHQRNSNPIRVAAMSTSTATSIASNPQSNCYFNLVGHNYVLQKDEGGSSPPSRSLITQRRAFEFATSFEAEARTWLWWGHDYLNLRLSNRCRSTLSFPFSIWVSSSCFFFFWIRIREEKALNC